MLLQPTNQVKEKPLGSGKCSIVTNKQNLERMFFINGKIRNTVRYRFKSPCCRIEIGESISLAWFKVRAFCPFVPCVDEDKTAVFWKMFLHKGTSAGQPCLIPLWSGTQVDGCLFEASRCIVPRWKYAGESGEWGFQFPEHALCGFFIVKESSGKVWS